MNRSPTSLWLRGAGSAAAQVLRWQMRRPSVWTLGLGAAIFGPLLAATALDPASPDGSARWAESLAFGTLVFLGLLLATTGAATSFADDAASGRGVLLRTRRAPASALVFGRWAGAWAFFLAWLAATGALATVPLHVLVHQGGAWPTTREFVLPLEVDFAGRKPIEPGAPFALAAGEVGRVEMPLASLRSERDLGLELAIALRFARRTDAAGSPESLRYQLPLRISVQADGGPERELFDGEVPWQPRLRLKLPSGLSGGRLTVLLRHEAGSSMLLLDPRDAQLYGGRRPAWLDRLQVAGGLSLLTGLVLAAAVLLSTAVSAPVALLGSLGFFVLGQSSGWLEEIFDRLASGQHIGHAHGEPEPWPTPVRLVFVVLARAFGVCPDFRVFEFLDQMLSGQAILWSQLARALAVMLIYGLPFLALGSLVWQRREMA